jgi:Uma2 family endonuclease
MTLTITPAHGEAFSLADWAAMPDDGRRYELVGGTIVVTPPPLVPHQRASRTLERLLEDAAPPEVEVFDAPVGLRLPGEQMLEPDLVVVPPGSAGHHYLHLPVLLVVEIVSRGSRLHDTVTKRAVYAEAGIEHYWLVDGTVSPARFTALRLTDGGYETVVETTGDVAVDAPVPVRFRVADLFRPRPRPSGTG